MDSSGRWCSPYFHIAAFLWRCWRDTVSYALMSLLADVRSLEESAIPSIIYNWISLLLIFPSFAYSPSSRFATLPVVGLHTHSALCTDFAYSGPSFSVTDCPRLSNSSAVSESETIFFALFAFLWLFFIYLTFFMATRLSGPRTLI